MRNFFAEIGKRRSSIDVILHCAAVLGPLGTFDTIDSEEWRAAVNTNLFGTYLVIKHALPLMQPEKRPRILVLSGGGAFDPMPNVSAYGASKAAIVRFVETIAVELSSRNIAANAVAPGFAPTDIHKATLAVGRELGGEHYDKTVKLISNWDNSMHVPIDCVRYMISDRSAKLTGKTISARYDPWDEPEFDEHIDEIAASPLYSTQRTIAEHLSNSALARTLAVAAERKRARYSRDSSGATAHMMSKQPAL